MATITWPGKERQGLHFLFCYWGGKLQRLEMNGGALGEEEGRKTREQHEWSKEASVPSPKKKAQKPFCVTDLCWYEPYQVKNRLPPSGWIPEMQRCSIVQTEELFQVNTHHAKSSSAFALIFAPSLTSKDKQQFNTGTRLHVLRDKAAMLWLAYTRNAASPNEDVYNSRITQDVVSSADLF